MNPSRSSNSLISDFEGCTGYPPTRIGDGCQGSLGEREKKKKTIYIYIYFLFFAYPPLSGHHKSWRWLPRVTGREKKKWKINKYIYIFFFFFFCSPPLCLGTSPHSDHDWDLPRYEMVAEGHWEREKTSQKKRIDGKIIIINFLFFFGFFFAYLPSIWAPHPIGTMIEIFQDMRWLPRVPGRERNKAKKNRRKHNNNKCPLFFFLLTPPLSGHPTP